MPRIQVQVRSSLRGMMRPAPRLNQGQREQSDDDLDDACTQVDDDPSDVARGGFEFEGVQAGAASGCPEEAECGEQQRPATGRVGCPHCPSRAACGCSLCLVIKCFRQIRSPYAISCASIVSLLADEAARGCTIVPATRSWMPRFPAVVTMTAR